MKQYQLLSALLLGVILMQPSTLRADQETKKTIFTFDRSVQVPGQDAHSDYVLPHGLCWSGAEEIGGNG